MSVADLILCIK